MKKKLFCIGLTLVIVFSLASCGKGSESTDTREDMIAGFEKVQDKMSDMKDTNLAINLDSTTTNNGQPQKISMSAEGDWVKKSKDEGTIDAAMNVTSKVSKSEMSGKVYINEKDIYMDMSGQKMKVKEKDEMSNLVSANTGALFDVDAKMVEEIEAIETNDGMVYHLNFDPKTAGGYLTASMKGMNNIVEIPKGAEVEKMELSVTVDEDNMAKNLTLEAKTKEQKDSGLSFTLSVDYKSINSGISIDFPDFKKYNDAPALTDLN